MSDTAADLSMGLNVIGRPSNKGGVELLIQRLRDWPADFPIVVVGEHDQKKDGSCPGREGAEYTGQRLADALGRPVLVGMPPDGAKDTRVWLNGQRPDLNDSAALAQLGQRFAEAVLASAETVQPRPGRTSRQAELFAATPYGVVASPRTPEPPSPLSADSAKELATATTAPDPDPRGDAWASARASGVGLYLDRQPPPHPAQTVQRAITTRGVRRSLTVLRSRADCESTAEAIAEAIVGVPGTGRNVAVYPQRTPENCDNHVEAALADRNGRPASSTICPTCLWREQCGYLPLLRHAETADHRVMTAARAAAIGSDDRSEVVFLLEAGLDVLAPHAVTPPLRPLQLDKLTTAVKEAEKRARQQRRHRDAQWWHYIAVHLDAIRSYLERGTARPIDLREPLDRSPQGWTSTLWALLRDGNRDPRVPQNLIRILAAAATNKLQSLTLARDDDRTQRQSGVAGAESIPPSLHLAAIWKPRPPTVPTIVVEHLDAADLTRATGAAVTDITGTTPPNWKTHAVQRPERWTASRRPGAISRAIRDHLASHDGRVTVLVPCRAAATPQLAAEVLATLPEADQGRVAMVSWYGREELPAADHVLALGVPAMPPKSVRQWLRQTGQVEAALADGDWGNLRWQGVTADGEVIPVDCWCYRLPEWQRAYQAAMLDQVHRRVARVRVPLTLVCDLPLGLPLGRKHGLPDRGRA